MADPIRVLHLSSESTWRGGEQQIIYLVEETRKLGVDAVIGCRQGSEVESYCIANDIPHHSFPFKSAYDISTARQIIKLCKEEHFDLIQTHTSKSHTMSVIAGLLGLGVPQIMTRRVDFPVKDNWFSKFKYNYSKIARIICISATIRRITEPDIKDKSKLVTIHSGADVTRFEPYRNSDWLRKEYTLDQGTMVIGNTSAISNQKDYQTFVQTAERILERERNAKFFIVGDGPEREEIKALVKKKGFSNKIIFTGFRKNIKEILPSLDVFLFTSETEGLGTDEEPIAYWMRWQQVFPFVPRMLEVFLKWWSTRKMACSVRCKLLSTRKMACSFQSGYGFSARLWTKFPGSQGF